MSRTIKEFIRNKKLAKQRRLQEEEERRRQAEDTEEAEERPLKRQQKGKGRQTTKRKQSVDEKKEKVTARNERKAAISEEGNQDRKPCPTCLAAARNDPARAETATTHSRSSSSLCPDYKKRKKLVVKDSLEDNQKIKTHTIKHGLYGLLREDIPNNDRNRIVNAITTVVDYNRRIVIIAHLFLLHYLTYRLNERLPIPAALFTKNFFYGIFQLLLGDSFSNERIFSNDLRRNIIDRFNVFIEANPGARCRKIRSPTGNREPNGFTHVLSSTGDVCASNMVNHVVENFDTFYILYLQCFLLRSVPELTIPQSKAYAHFIYQTTVNDPKFPPIWPNVYTSESIDQKLSQCIEDLVDQTSEEWIEVQALITLERRNRQQHRRQATTMSSNVTSVASSSTSPLEPDIPIDAPSPTSSISTIESMGLSNMQIATPTTTGFSVTTATLSEYPHIFLGVLYKILHTMENWNAEDQELPRTPQTEASRTWVYHFLADLPEWRFIKRPQRSALVHGIKKAINNQSQFERERIPSKFGLESMQAIQNFVEQAQQELKDGVFQPPTFLVRHQSRLFTIAPCPGFTRKYIRIEHVTLGSILKFFDLKQYAYTQNTPVQANGIHPNFNIFDFSKLKEHGIFQNSFSTDGFATSFTFLKVVSTDSLPPITLDDLTPDDLNHCKIWGVDPGVKEVFVAVDGSDQGIYNDSETSANGRHHVVKFSSVEYYVKAGFKKTNTTICQMKRAQEIDTLESGMVSAKTALVDQINQYITSIISRLNRLSEFYGLEIQQLKFLNYIGRQKVHNELLDIFLTGGKKYSPDINHQVSRNVVDARSKPDGSLKRKRRKRAPEAIEPPNNPSNTERTKWRKLEFQRTPEDIVPVVCLGDGNFGRRTFRGHAHGLARTFKKLLQKAENQGHLLVVDVNEGYTSQVCSGCGGKELENLKLSSSSASTMHSVLACKSCRRVWQRDINAARNIHALAMIGIEGGERPAVFQH